MWRDGKSLGVVCCEARTLGSSRGGQGVSEALNGSILGRLCAIWYFGKLFVTKVLCMQCGTLAWILDVYAFISAWDFDMVAASHCSCFSQCVGRGQGSAAGAAEDHMTCMLDALKCMGLYT